MLTIGQRLVELRKNRRLSQAAFSDELGLNRATYAQWELDRRRPELDSLIQIADYYGVSVDYVLGREGVTAAASRSDDPLSDLPEDARKSVVEFIDFVRKRSTQNKKNK